MTINLVVIKSKKMKGRNYIDCLFIAIFKYRFVFITQINNYHISRILIQIHFSSIVFLKKCALAAKNKIRSDSPAARPLPFDAYPGGC